MTDLNKILHEYFQDYNFVLVGADFEKIIFWKMTATPSQACDFRPKCSSSFVNKKQTRN